MDIGYSRELGLGAVKSRLKWTMEWTEINILTNEWLREASRSYFCSCFMLPRSVWTENFVSVFEVRTYLSIYYFGFESRGFIFLMLSRKVGFFFAVWARKRELCLQRYVWVETQLINCGVYTLHSLTSLGAQNHSNLCSCTSPWRVPQAQRYIVRRKTEKPWLPDQGLDQ